MRAQCFRPGDWIEVRHDPDLTFVRTYYIVQADGDDLVCALPATIPEYRAYVNPMTVYGPIKLIGTSKPNPWYKWLPKFISIHPVKFVPLPQFA